MVNHDRNFARITCSRNVLCHLMHTVLQFKQSPCLPQVQSLQRYAHTSCPAPLALKCFSHHWPFVRGNRRPVDSLHGNVDILLSCFMVTKAGDHTFESSVDMKFM